jgi:hypothetical protein
MGVQGLRFKGSRVQGQEGSRVQGSRVQGSRVQRSRFKVQSGIIQFHHGGTEARNDEWGRKCGMMNDESAFCISSVPPW